MKKLILVLFVFTIAVFSQNVTVYDFNVPVSRATSLRFDGNWNWSQNGDVVTSNTANGTILYKTFYSSLPTAWFIDYVGNAGKSFGDYNHYTRLSAIFRKYIFEKEDFFANSELFMDHANNYKQIRSYLTVGFGYGRYINATSLAKAVRIEGHLLKDKAISKSLSKNAILEVAYLIERENEYREIYGTTFETFWLSDIEDKINADIENEDGIGSLGILRMRQVLFNINERVNNRYYGWDVNLGIKFPISDAFKQKLGNPNLSLSVEYSIPVNWNFQINTSANIYTPIDSAFFKDYSLGLKTDLIYELSNRINFVTNYELLSQKRISTDLSLQHHLNASFWYYIENNIYIVFSSSYTKQGDLPKILSSNVGIQYNLF